MSKYIIYSRKSKITGVGDSINTQIESARQLLFKKYLNIKEEEIIIFKDEGFSGGTSKRPAYQQMLNLIQQEPITAICAYRLDRLSRSVIDFVELLKLCDSTNTHIHLVNDNYDIDTYSGKAMLMIASIFAELERSIIKERITDNLIALSKQGRWLGGITPTGYASVKQPNSNNAKMLQLIPDEADQIKSLFTKYLELQSLTRLETYCLSHNILSKNNKNYTRCSLQSILMNPTYCTADLQAYEYFTNLGCTIYNTDDLPIEDLFNGEHGMLIYKKTDQSKPTKKYTPPQEWIVTVGQHPPIISSDMFIKTQELLKLNSDKSYRQPRHTANVALLPSLLYCKHCGSYMRPQRTNRIYKDTGQPAHRYLCELASKSQKTLCQCVSVNGNVLDKIVVDEIFKIIENLNIDQEIIINELLNTQQDHISNNDLQQNINTLQQQQANIQHQIDNLINKLAIIEDDDVVDSIQEAIKTRKNDILTIKNKIETLQSTLNTQTQQQSSVEELIQSLLDFKQLFNTANIDIQRSLLREIVQKVEYDYVDKSIIIYFVQGDKHNCVYITDKTHLQSIPYVHTGILPDEDKPNHTPMPIPQNNLHIFQLMYTPSEHLSLFYHIDMLKHITYKAVLTYHCSLPPYYTDNNDFDFIASSNFNTLGSRLKRERLLRGFKQTEIAAVLNMHKSTYIKLENNQYTLSDVKLHHIVSTLANFYQIDVSDLLT